MPNASYYQSLINSSPNLRRFLDTIGWAEGATYNTGFGGRTISSLAWHPYPQRAFGHGGDTTSAAGKYQFQRGTWDRVARSLGLTSFSPTNQDIAAVALIDGRGQLKNVLDGNISGAITGLRDEWESFKVRPLSSIVQKFGGGTITTPAPNVSAQPVAGNSNDFFNPNVTVIGAKNRYLIAFAILVIIFIFAFQ